VFATKHLHYIARNPFIFISAPLVCVLPYPYTQHRRNALMWIFVNLAMLVLATLVAGAAAVAVYWLLLRATVEMMRPAAAPAARLRREGSK
jgi:hypothetical protein